VIVSETMVTPRRHAAVDHQTVDLRARGEGGFGGERGPSTAVEPPDRAPDVEVALPILPQQALLYRLCGAHNPLHSGSEFAAAAVFPRPILHGLCTYGIGCKAIVDTFLDGDVSRVRSYGARFASVVFPVRRCRPASGRRTTSCWQQHHHSAEPRRRTGAVRGGTCSGLGTRCIGGPRSRFRSLGPVELKRSARGQTGPSRGRRARWGPRVAECTAQIRVKTHRWIPP
jgi:hypothetical protein